MKKSFIEKFFFILFSLFFITVIAASCDGGECQENETNRHNFDTKALPGTQPTEESVEDC
ncbi:MAG: hypothetical protein IJ748_07295 [Bacteroidales bacterium]|nr:hypothetical protein [Bacteroidales bacterium]